MCCGYEFEFWWVFPLVFCGLMVLFMFLVVWRGSDFCGPYFKNWRGNRERIERLEEEMKDIKSKNEGTQ